MALNLSLFLCFITILPFVLLLKAWENPIEVFSSSQTIVSHKIYVDERSLTHHILFITDTGSELTAHYISIDKYGHRSAIRHICPSSSVSNYYDITGANDGLRIYIVVGVLYNGKNVISYLESYDSGRSWKQKLVVHEMDSYHRIHPSIEFSVANNRLWIFYFKTADRNKGTISFLNRIGNASFAEEREVRDHYDEMQIPFRYKLIDVGTRSQMFLAYLKQEANGTVADKYFISSNEAITWETCDKKLPNPILLNIDLVVHNKFPNIIIQDHSWVDQGKGFPILGAYKTENFWASTQEWAAQSKAVHSEIAGVICLTSTGYQHYLYGTNERDKQLGHQFSSINIDFGGGRVEEEPFRVLNPRKVYSPKLNCYSVAEGKHLFASAAIQLNERYSIYISKANLSQEKGMLWRY